LANVYYKIDCGADGPAYIAEEKLTPATHEALFSFLRFDFGLLDNAMSELLEILDVGTLNADTADKKDKLKKVYNILKDVHPYYRYGFNAEAEMNAAIQINLNFLLYNNGHGREQLLLKEKYLEILAGFLPHAIKRYDGEYLDECYERYVEFKPLDEIIEGTGYSFKKIFDAKDRVRRMLFWIFDFSVPELSHLTVYQRAHLYDSIFNDSADIELKKSYSFGLPEGRYGRAIFAFSDEDDQIAVFHMHNNDYRFDSENNAPFPEVVNDLISEALQVTSSPVSELCEINDLEELLNIELINMLDQNIIIKRCKYCGNYFVAENMKNEYCNGYAPNEKRPCTEIGSARAYQNKVKKDEIYTLFQRAYKTHFARIKKGKMTPAAFNIWSIEGKQKMADAREGKITTDEYLAWLKV